MKKTNIWLVLMALATQLSLNAYAEEDDERILNALESVHLEPQDEHMHANVDHFIEKLKSSIEKLKSKMKESEEKNEHDGDAVSEMDKEALKEILTALKKKFAGLQIKADLEEQKERLMKRLAERHENVSSQHNEEE